MENKSECDGDDCSSVWLLAVGLSNPGLSALDLDGLPVGGWSQARRPSFTFRAVAADSAYGDQDGFRSDLAEAGALFVMAPKPRRGPDAYDQVACGGIQRVGVLSLA